MEPMGWSNVYCERQRLRLNSFGGDERMELTTEQHPLRPTTRNSLAVDVADRIRDSILVGYFKPGERLREEHLAAQLEVSRGPIRNALVMLAQEGLVSLRHHRGASVARLSSADIEEVYSLRLALERLAAERAAARLSAADIEAMESALERLNEAVGRGVTAHEAAALDTEFHDLIYRASGHLRLEHAWSEIKSQTYLFMLRRNVTRADFSDQTVAGHAVILDALRSGDPSRAGDVVEAHIRTAFVMIQGDVDQSHANPRSAEPTATESPAG